MKKLVFAVVAVLVLLATGCRENSVIDPVSAGAMDKQSLGSGGTILLDGILRLPGELTSSYEIKGTIRFVEKVSPIVPTSSHDAPDVTLSKASTSAPQFYGTVIMAVNATLNNSGKPMHNEWYISSKSEDHFYISANGNYILEKSYRVEGRNDDLVLICKFDVTTNSVQLVSRWLSFPVGVSTTGPVNDTE